MPAAAARKPVPAILIFGIVPVFFHLAILATNHVQLGFAFSFPALCKLGFVSVSALTHWGIYLTLLLTFGLTLRRGHEPLITTMARRMHGSMPPEMARYTRRVTIAWCGFFATQLTVSVLLFCFAPLIVWSFFVNILDIPLVVTMFAVEYAVRLRVLRNPPRHSLAGILNLIAETGRPALRANAARPD